MYILSLTKEKHCPMSAAAVQGHRYQVMGENTQEKPEAVQTWEHHLPGAQSSRKELHSSCQDTLGMLGSSLPTGSIRGVLFLAAQNKSQLHHRVVGVKVTSHLDTVRATSTILRAGEAPVPEQCFSELSETSKTTAGTAAASQCHLLAAGPLPPHRQ